MAMVVLFPILVLVQKPMDSRTKDRLWKEYKQARETVKDNYCTKKELANPTERNVQKCMAEIRKTRQVSEPMKNIGRLLGEETSVEKFRRGR